MDVMGKNEAAHSMSLAARLLAHVYGVAKAEGMTGEQVDAAILSMAGQHAAIRLGFAKEEYLLELNKE